MSDPIYLAIHVPEFPAQAMLRLRPHLLRKPVVILQGTPPLQQVCSMNAAARGMGVLRGMTRAQLDAFEGLHLLAQADREESSARNALLEAAAVFTPRIEIEAPRDNSFCMLLDMTGTSLMWGEISSAIRRIASAIRGLRIQPRMAACSNAETSLCLAAVAQRAPVVVTKGKEAEALAGLPLEILPLSAETQETLKLWGLHTLNDLAALPLSSVVSRLGAEGRRLHALASGSQQHLFVPEDTPFVLEENIALDAPLEILDSLLFVLGPMLDQLIRRAVNRSFALASITLHLALDGGNEHVCTVRPALPSSERKVLLKLLQLHLQTHPPAAGVTALLLTAEPGDRSKVQLGLFAPQLPEPMRLDVTLARIAAMVGEENVGRPVLLDTHGEPEFSMEKFTLSTSPMRKRTPVVEQAPATVLRRCRPPVELNVRTLRQQHGAQPHSFYLHGKQYAVLAAYGPWRQSGDWWSADVWSREDWDVHAQVEGGNALLCVLRFDLLRKQWTLEAIYD